MRSREEIEKALSEIEALLPNIVQGTVMEGLYVGQAGALRWILEGED